MQARCNIATQEGRPVNITAMRSVVAHKSHFLPLFTLCILYTSWLPCMHAKFIVSD